MKDSSRSARAFSSEATTRKMSLIESIPRNPCASSTTRRWKIVFWSIKRRQSSSVMSDVTVTSSRVMISDAFIHAGHLFSAATLSDTSLCEITPESLPSAFTTPTARTCFSRRYCAAWCTLVSSVIENTSLRDPIRSDTFMGLPRGHPCRMVGPTYPGMQDEIVSPIGSQGYRNRRDRVMDAPRSAKNNLKKLQSRPGGFTADDIVPLDDRRHSHTCITVFHAALHANNFAEGSHEYLCAM